MSHPSSRPSLDDRLARRKEHAMTLIATRPPTGAPARGRSRRLLVPGLVAAATLVAGGVAAANQLTGTDVSPHTPPPCPSQDWHCLQPLAAATGAVVFGPPRTAGDTITGPLHVTVKPGQTQALFHFTDPGEQVKGEAYSNFGAADLRTSHAVGVTSSTPTTIHGLPARIDLSKNGAMVIWQEDNRSLAVWVTHGNASQAIAIAQSFVAYKP
jgi:hypothetical protein